MIIFHQPRFPWNKGMYLTKPPFRVRSCEVAIVWPDNISVQYLPQIRIFWTPIRHLCFQPQHSGQHESIRMPKLFLGPEVNEKIQQQLDEFKFFCSGPTKTPTTPVAKIYFFCDEEFDYWRILGSFQSDELWPNNRWGGHLYPEEFSKFEPGAS